MVSASKVLANRVNRTQVAHAYFVFHIQRPMENLYISFLPNQINDILSSFRAQRGSQCLHSDPVITTTDLLFHVPFILGSCSRTVKAKIG